MVGEYTHKSQILAMKLVLIYRRGIISEIIMNYIVYHIFNIIQSWFYTKM